MEISYLIAGLYSCFLWCTFYFSDIIHFCWMNFQSRVGPVQWLKPYTDEVLVELGQKGVKSLLAVPVRYIIIDILRMLILILDSSIWIL